MLKGFRFYDSPSADEPVVEAPRVSVGLECAGVVVEASRGHGTSGCAALEVQLRLAEKGNPARRTTLALNRVNTEIRVRPGGLDVLSYAAEMFDIQFRGAGTLRRQRPGDKARPSGPHGLENIPSWVFKIIEQARELHYQKPPQARLHFFVTTDAPELTRMVLKAQGRLTETPVGAFDRWSLEAGLEPHRLVLKSAVLLRGASRLSLTGSLSLPEMAAEFRLFSDISLVHGHEIIPQAWRCPVRQGRL